MEQWNGLYSLSSANIFITSIFKIKFHLLTFCFRRRGVLP